MNGVGALLFVYNADSGLFNTLGDIGHKLFSPSTYPCQLCAITHGYLKERSQWRAFIDSLDLTCEFLHRDQFRERFPGLSASLPAVFRLANGRPKLCLDSAAINACADMGELMRLIRRACLDDG